MYHLRRAAVRSLSSHTFRIANDCAVKARVTRWTPLKKVSVRPFSHTTLWRADEQPSSSSEQESQTVAETEAEEASRIIEETFAPGETSQIHEESISDPTVADAAANQEPSQTPVRDFSSESSAPRGHSKILYVGNLYFEVTTAQLEAEFSRFGEIINARVVTDSGGLSKGFAFIEFSESSAAARAVEEQKDQVFQGRRMNVQYHISRNRPDSNPVRNAEPSTTLFIGNMSYQMSDRDLSNLFRPLKDVVDVRVAIDRRTGQPRGFAHADFTSIEAATAARQQLNGRVVSGRQLKAGFSSPAKLNPPSDQSFPS